jgi:hypothetical protein
LCDAEWNKRKELAEQFRQVADGFEKNPGIGEFAFGEIDVDDPGLADFLNECKLTNVPAVIYIWNDAVSPMRSIKIGNHKIKEHIVSVLVEKEMRQMGYSSGVN